MEPITASLIAGGAALASSAGNMLSQGSMNKKTRQWNEKMYNQQKQDNLAQWTLQNEYNSPEKQMERLTKAGLNPNLVYGNGATTTAGSIDSSNVPSWNPRAPEIDFSTGANNGLAAYFDVQTKAATVDNLKAQNTVLAQEAALKAATTAQTAQSTARSKFDLELASELRNNSLDMAKETLRGAQIGNQFQLAENERRTALNSSSLQEAAERILKSRADRTTSITQRRQLEAQIKELGASTELKQIEKDLRKQGIGPNDPMWMRILIQSLSGFSPGNLLKNGVDKVKDLYERGKSALQLDRPK